MVSSVERALEKRTLTKKNKALIAQLEELSVRDPLTGLYNMRPFYTYVDSEIERASQESNELGLLFVDIDHFKKINDSFGHVFGDYVLQIFATLLESEIHEPCRLFRYGGEEFIIVLPKSNIESLTAISERLLKSVRQYPFAFQDKETHITVSIGAATYPAHASNQEDLIRRADKELYNAKSSGRDCYSIAKIEEVSR